MKLSPLSCLAASLVVVATLAAPASAEKSSDPLGAKISIDVQDAELVNVLRLIADVTDLNVIIDPSIDEKITLKLDEVSWDQVLNLVLRMYQLGQLREGNVLLIAPIDHEVFRPRVERASGPMETRIIQVNYASAADLKPILESAALSRDGTITVDERTNVLIIHDHGQNIRDAIRLIGHR